MLDVMHFVALYGYSSEEVVLHDIVEANRWKMAPLHDIVALLRIVETDRWEMPSLKLLTWQCIPTVAYWPHCG